MLANTLASVAAIASAALLLRDLPDRDEGPGGGGHYHPEPNTYGLPNGYPIEEALKAWYDHIARETLGAIPDRGVDLPARLPDVTDYADPMASAMTPLLSPYWDESGKRVMARLKLDPDEWRVTNPYLHAKIHEQAYNFCQSTLETTSKEINAAKAALKAALAEGLVEKGETLHQLRDRVQGVFETMPRWKAAQIAATEASRAVHAAQLEADKQSEVVAGEELLLSSDACPLCRKIATECKRVKLGDAFAVVGNNPTYKTLHHPPLHPRCQCALISVLKPEYGGPENPEWGKTLDQPQKGLGDDYEPPKGMVVPEPEPERLKPVEPPKPPNVPVSAALDVRAKGELADQIRAAIDTIDEVHGDGALPEIPVFGKGDGKGSEGAFGYSGKDGRALDIMVNPKAKHPRVTLAHETGHFLDNSGIPGNVRGKRDWAQDPFMREWFKAVQESETVKKLETLRGQSTVEVKLPNGKDAKLKLGGGYVEYLLRPDELWARSYAQYIATRSHDSEMRKQMGERMAQKVEDVLPHQWRHQDFEPIAAKIDELFGKLGWLPPPKKP